MNLVGVAPKQYLEARLEVPRVLADAVCDFITDNIVSGLVLEEEEDSPNSGIIFYVAEGDTEFQARLNDYLSGLIGDEMPVLPDIRMKPVADTEWVEKYKQSVKAISIGEDIVVRPTWVDEAGVDYEIIIEPKMAFGTGSHGTTYGCLVAIRRLFENGGSFLDLGCGSGILSILADKMGATFIKAIDYDLVAVENCRENFNINRIAARYEILFGSVEHCDGDDQYDLVCVNIIRSTILTMLERLVNLTSSGGNLILSGLMPSDEKEIVTALAECGQNEIDFIRKDSWLTILVKKS